MRARYLEELNQDMLNTHVTEVSSLIIWTVRSVSLSLYDHVMAHVQTRENKTFYYRFTYHRKDKDEHSLDIFKTKKKL